MKVKFSYASYLVGSFSEVFRTAVVCCPLVFPALLLNSNDFLCISSVNHFFKLCFLGFTAISHGFRTFFQVFGWLPVSVCKPIALLAISFFFREELQVCFLKVFKLFSGQFSINFPNEISTKNLPNPLEPLNPPLPPINPLKRAK